MIIMVAISFENKSSTGHFCFPIFHMNLNIFTDLICLLVDWDILLFFSFLSFFRTFGIKHGILKLQII